MSPQERPEGSDIVLSPEEHERFQELADEVTDTLENMEMFLEPGDRFAIHPATFALAEGFGEEDSRMKAILLQFIFDAFHLQRSSLESFRKIGNEQWFKTSNPELVIGTDGTDWWLEFVSSVPDEEIAVKIITKHVSAKVKKAARKKAPTVKKRK